MSIPFLNNLTIILKSIPSYPHFECGFTEPMDAHLLQLIAETNNPDITVQMKTNLENSIIKNIKKNKLSVKHHQTYGIGRFYADGDVSLIPHSKYIKHTLFKYMGWLDIDMVKGHPSIAVLVGRLNRIACPSIETYINSFDEICDTLINFYQDEVKLTKDDIKYVFCIMLYGGGFKRWVTELESGCEKNGYKPKKIKNKDVVHPIIESFKNECKVIVKKVYTANPALVKKLKKEGEEKWETECRVISYWFQIIENHILYTCYDFLVSKGIVSKSVCGLEYDGLCIPPLQSDIDKFEVTNELNAFIESETGLPIKMKFKDYDENYILYDIIEKRKEMVIAEPIEEATEAVNVEVEYFATEFEKTHAKIIERGCYIKQRESDVLIMSPKLLNDSYSHLIGGYTENGSPINFIKRWTTNNEFIRKYINMDIYPDASKCPEGYFNLWIPFKFEKQIEGFVYKPECEKTASLLNHIKLLCNHQKEVYEYIVEYIAQMIQFPAVKSIVPTFISNQGAGKGTLMKLLTRMLGASKVLETSTPSRDVWGNFNSLMASAFLVNLNELSKKETIEAEGQIKTLSTDSTLTINQKGINQSKITSYHRFIITTNKEDPLNTTIDDRRNIIIRSSDEKCGDKKYFETLNEYLDDDFVIKNIYEYFKQIKGVDKFGLKPIPHTTYQDNLKQGNRSVIDLWMESFVMKYSNENKVVKENYELFAEFNEWKRECNIQYEINNIKFGCKLSNMSISGLTREGTHKRVFNIPVMKNHYKL